MNNRPHQTMAPLSILLAEQPFYAYPYAHLPAGPGDVLIVGAGSGNDVALALAEGATHVDAVEIDPVLQRLGRDLHPDHPYQDPRVTVHIDDGRAFLERTHHRYDLILFALPDSLTLVSGQGGAAAGELPVHDRGDADRARPPAAGRRVRDVQLLPPRRVRPLRRNPHARCSATRPCIDRGGLGAITRSQSVLTIGLEADSIVCDTPVRGAGQRAGAGHRRPPVPVPARPDDPLLLPRGARARCCWPRS